MPVNVRWVRIDGTWLIAITLPHHQHALIAPADAWILLLYLRAALRNKPSTSGDN